MPRCPHCTSRLQLLLTQCPTCRPQHRGLASLAINFIRWYAQAFAKYAVFNGRASGQEFWSFVIINMAMLYALVYWGPTGQLSFYINETYVCFLLVPTLSVLVRRTHDINLRAGWLLIWPLTAMLLLIGSFYLENFFFPLPDDVDPEMLDEPFCVFPLITIMFILPLLLLLFIVQQCLPGMCGKNRFGPDPRQAFNIPATYDNASTSRN